MQSVTGGDNKQCGHCSLYTFCFSDKYKEVNELRKKLFISDTQVFFQTEDLSFLDDNTSADTEAPSPTEDDRQEATE